MNAAFPTWKETAMEPTSGKGAQPENLLRYRIVSRAAFSQLNVFACSRAAPTNLPSTNTRSIAERIAASL